MSKRLENLNSIVGVLTAGAKFYRQSARTIDGSDLEELFLEHAELRENVASELSRIIDEAGAEPADPAASEQARAWAARAGTLFSDTEDTLVRSLKEHEDRTIEVFREAIHHKDNSEDKDMLSEYLERFETAHEKMRKLNQSTTPGAAAAEL